MQTENKQDVITLKAIVGCLTGCAVGDSIGLPMEGMSKQRQSKMFPSLENHQFIAGKGMISDDTEHHCMTAQALIESAGNPEKFQKALSWKLRFWLLGLPAGVGYATIRSIIKLWIGFPPNKSGVFSAGNGPSMRSAIIGLFAGDNPDLLKQLVKISTRMTHSDPKAEYGALAVAVAAYLAAKKSPVSVTSEEYMTELGNYIDNEAEEFINLIKEAINSVQAEESTQDFAINKGWKKGVSGYTYHTVPVVIHSWLRYQNDFKTAITEVIKCGGDTDSTAAILGAIMGASTGKEGMPEKWVNNIFEFPRSVRWIESSGKRLYEVKAEQKAKSSLPANPLLTFIRNIIFMLIVLAHVVRRFLPPY